MGDGNEPGLPLFLKHGFTGFHKWLGMESLTHYAVIEAVIDCNKAHTEVVRHKGADNTIIRHIYRIRGIKIDSFIKPVFVVCFKLLYPKKVSYGFTPAYSSASITA